jgi:hypothetical protein
MAIDFIKDPPPDIAAKPFRCDFFKPQPVDTPEKLEADRAQLAKEKAAFEATKAQLEASQLQPEEPKKGKKKGLDEPLGDRG